MSVIRSRDNARVKHWSKLVRDSRCRRREGRALIEGPHLLAALLDAGLRPLALLATEGALAGNEIRQLVKKAGLDPVLLTPAVFGSVVDAENPPGVAAEIALPEVKNEDSMQSVFLEGVQDPGNVGAILRSAAALGVSEAVLDRHCADAWSPKVLRAGMGAHFKLAVRSEANLGRALESFEGKLLCTVPRGGVPLRHADLDGRLGWIFGAEGQGVSEATARRADGKVTIPLSPGSESLNVAAAAAICFYETSCRGGMPPVSVPRPAAGAPRP